MKIQLGKLREFIREAIAEASGCKKYNFGYAGSHPEEDYEVGLLDDPSYKKKSVYVPDDIKDKIDKWAADMGMKTNSRKKR